MWRIAVVSLLLCTACRSDQALKVDQGEMDTNEDTGTLDSTPDTEEDETAGDTSDDTGEDDTGEPAPIDLDGDGFAAGDDCDDLDADTFPGAPERCDGIDNDCDGEVDEDLVGTWYEDADGDGHGNAASSLAGCDPPSGFVADTTDCDDTRANVSPVASEVCDGLDNDCDGDVDTDALDATAWFADADGDGFGDANVSQLACLAPGTYLADDTDCDDTNAAVHPNATELCDGIDNNCDGWVDDDGPTVADPSTWYEDADGDGHGNAGSSVAACDQPSGFVADATDCDDTRANVSPVASEVCDGLDNDCDGDVDTDALDATAWFVDADGDGFGDANVSLLACLVPGTYLADDTDCDDTNAAVHPGATELCDGIDNNCDGWVDDDDPVVADASTWYLDFDGDGYGTAAFSVEACSQPSSYSANTDDCDDTQAAIHPAATEVCDGVDNDCDGTVDESDAADASTWYLDADGDGFGDAGNSLYSCDQPSGYLVDNTDCDDSNADVFPGRGESYDGLDNDCDGAIDEDLWMGSGTDGPLTVTATTDLSTDASGARTQADAISFGVIALSGDSVGVDQAIVGIAPGDEVLLINLQGTDAAHGAVGTYEFGTVDSVVVTTITLVDPLSETFGETDNSDLSGQVIRVQRVPHYSDVTVASTGTLTTSPWAGSGGGVLAFRASATVHVEAGGAITVDDAGYAGGATGSGNNCDAFQGESYAGEGSGDGDGFCAAYNEYWGWYDPNFGGGGSHICGAGGAYDIGATDADSWTGGSATPAYAGTTYGNADLGTLFFGSGGGGVWNGGTSCIGTGPGAGGGGGGILFIGAHTLQTDDAAAITSGGGSSDACASGSYKYGAGGGAGGSVFLQAEDASLFADSVQATGGFGNSSNQRVGGDGGQGRIRIDCTTCNGFAHGSVDSDAALDDAASPDPGHSVSP